MKKMSFVLVVSFASLLAHPHDGWSQDAGEGPGVPSLAEIYAPYFPIGAAVETRCLTARGDLLASQVSSLTPENAMKWEKIHVKPDDAAGSYSFSAADRIVAFAQERGMKVRGHALVWHRQTPSWVFEASEGPAGAPGSKAEVIARMKGHIAALLGRYRGRVYCWDVVNEAIAEAADAWRTDSPWHATAGSDDDRDGLPDYIVEAFAAARAADPLARLFYNDYGIESGPKLDRACALVKALKQRHLIDGVGIQGHWSIYEPDWDLVRRGIERLADLGVEVQITELDISVYRWGDSSSLKSLPEDRDRLQARRYAGLFAMLRGQASAGRLTGVTFWGISDDHTWLTGFPVAGRKDWPLPFDTAHRPKPALAAIARW